MHNINVVDAILEATQDSELAARISFMIKPSRFSELDDDDGSISYWGSDNNG